MPSTSCGLGRKANKKRIKQIPVVLPFTFFNRDTTLREGTPTFAICSDYKHPPGLSFSHPLSTNPASLARPTSETRIYAFYDTNAGRENCRSHEQRYLRQYSTTRIPTKNHTKKGPVLEHSQLRPTHGNCQPILLRTLRIPFSCPSPPKIQHHHKI